MKTAQNLISLEAARELLPVPTSIATLRRWAAVGVRGVRLRTTRVGKRLYCTAEDLAEFQAAVDAIFAELVPA